MNPSDPSQSATKTHTADTRNPDWDTYAPKGEGRTDEQIRADVHQLLVELPDALGRNITIDVKDGVVTASGQVDGAAQRQKLDQLVRAVKSVREFRDELKVGS